MNRSRQNVRAPADSAQWDQSDASAREAWDACDDAPRIGGTGAGLPAVARDALSESQMDWLVSTIESNIIPRLLQAHRQSGAPGAPEPTAEDAAADAANAATDPAQVAALARLILANDASVTRAHVEALRVAGMPLESIYLRVLAPAARHLGEMWEADLCDFTQVTIGLWRLQQLMYELSPAFQGNAPRGVQLRRAMLVPVPGSQHTLGLLMVAEFFRRAGWDVWGDPTASAQDLVDAARRERFDIVGFSVGTQSHFGALTSAIAAIRRASSNPSIKVMVGGPVFVEDPGLVSVVGADATAPDAAQAVRQAERLVAAAAG